MSDFVSKREYDNLLKKVIGLEDTIVKLKRNLNDDLENLDIDNFSESFKVKQDKASLEITKTAKELSVKMEAYDTSMAKMQSEIKQTADAISLKVKKYADEQISTAAETITAESITQTVSRAFFEVVKINDGFSSEGKDTEKIYFSKEDNASYYYNSISKEWKETSGKSIYSAFIQTDDGFEFNGDVVKISGDLITEGTISAERIDTSDLSARRIYAENDDNSFSISINPSSGSVGLYSSLASDDLDVAGDKCLFGIAVDTTSAIDMYARGNAFLGYNTNQQKAYPKGVWDFTSEGTSVLFRDDGVNAIAVFG